MKELNIKRITRMTLEDMPKKYNPNRGALGKMYKKDAGPLAKRIEAGDISDLDNTLYNVEYVMSDKEGYISSKFDYYSDDGKRSESIIYLSSETTAHNRMEAEVNHFRRQVNVLRKDMGLKMYDNVYIETMGGTFWSAIDRDLIEHLRVQLGGRFNIVYDLEIPVKTIKTLSGKEISLRIEKL
jgi:hypothetical protein